MLALVNKETCVIYVLRTNLFENQDPLFDGGCGKYTLAIQVGVHVGYDKLAIRFAPFPGFSM